MLLLVAAPSTLLINAFGIPIPFTTDGVEIHVPRAKCCIGFECLDLTEYACQAASGTFHVDDTCASGGACDPLMIVSSHPPHGAIDARQPSALSLNCEDEPGFSSIELTFNGNTAGLSLDSFSLAIHPSGEAPALVNFSVLGNTATLNFDRRIPPDHWTIVRHLPSDTFVQIGNLPGDVDNDATSNPVDILRLIDHLNGVIQPPYAIWQTDIDRSGQANPADILRLIDLLNGADCYEPWNGVSLPLEP